MNESSQCNVTKVLNAGVAIWSEILRFSLIISIHVWWWMCYKCVKWEKSYKKMTWKININDQERGIGDTVEEG